MILMRVIDAELSHQQGREVVVETQVADDSLPLFRRMFGQRIKDFWAIDENGNKIKSGAPTANSVLNELRKRAKDLGVKGFQKMDEDGLVKAIQEAYVAQSKGSKSKNSVTV